MLRDNYREYMGLFEMFLENYFQKPMLLCSFNTYQFDDYDKYVCEVFSKDEKADGDGLRSDEQVLAEWIAEETKGDLFAIRTARKYPTGYDDILEAGKQEKMEDARPILTSRLENLPDYRTIYFVYPNWWGDLPMPVYSFFDEYDFSGKKIIAVVISGGGGFAGTSSPECRPTLSHES